MRFIPPILYEKFPEIDSFTDERIEKEFNKINSSITVKYSIRRKTNRSSYILKKRNSKVVKNNLLKYKSKLKKIITYQ